MENINITPNKKRLDQSSLIIIFLTVLVLVLFSFLGNYAISNGVINLDKINLSRKPKVTINYDAINLTSPIRTLFTAKITHKTNKYVNVDVIPITPLSSTDVKQMNLKIGLTDKTTISTQEPYIPYSFKKIDSSEPKQEQINENNLEIGDYVDITLTTDFRTTNSNSLFAENIIKIANSDILTGKIKISNEDSILVSGVVRSTNIISSFKTNNVESPERDYLVNINNDTEISTNDHTGIRKLTPSDLNEEDNITVYTISPIIDNAVTANLISVNRI